MHAWLGSAHLHRETAPRGSCGRCLGGYPWAAPRAGGVLRVGCAASPTAVLASDGGRDVHNTWGARTPRRVASRGCLSPGFPPTPPNSFFTPAFSRPHAPPRSHLGPSQPPNSPHPTPRSDQPRPGSLLPLPPLCFPRSLSLCPPPAVHSCSRSCPPPLPTPTPSSLPLRSSLAPPSSHRPFCPSSIVGERRGRCSAAAGDGAVGGDTDGARRATEAAVGLRARGRGSQECRQDTGSSRQAGIH